MIRVSSETPRPFAVAPGVVPLRLLSLGEIYDGSISAVRANPRAMLGIAALMAAATALADGLSAAWLADPLAVADDAVFLLGSLIPLAVSFLATLIATGLLTAVVAAAVLGREMTAGQAWRAAGGRLVALLGVTLAVGVIVGALLLLPIVAGILLGIANPVVGLLLGVLLMIPAAGLAIYLSVAWLLAPPVLILEGRGVIDSLRRSRLLVARSWWRILGIALLGYVLVSLVASILALPASIIEAVVTISPDAAPYALPLARAAASLISGIVTIPFSAAMITLLYVDVRMRREGLDLDLAFAPPAPDLPILEAYSTAGRGR